MGSVSVRSFGRRWAPWIGGAVGVAALAWVFAGIDYAALGKALTCAEPGYLALVPTAIALEQLARAWKWRQILFPLRRIGTVRLFGAIVALSKIGITIGGTNHERMAHTFFYLLLGRSPVLSQPPMSKTLPAMQQAASS